MSAPQRFRKKPIEIEAMLLDGTSEISSAVIDWVRGFGGKVYAAGGYITENTHALQIFTLEGTMLASPGDWIIRGVQGEFYPCRGDIFTATYDSLDDPHAGEHVDHGGFEDH